MRITILIPLFYKDRGHAMKREMVQTRRINNRGIDRKFSLYDVEQFIREAGAEHVTEDAVLSLERGLNSLAERITNRAQRYANHAGRKRLTESDIKLASEG